FEQVDEAARSEKRMIPSAKIQFIQSAEAGVMSRVLVRSAQKVGKGMLFVWLDDTPIPSIFDEQEAYHRRKYSSFDKNMKKTKTQSLMPAHLLSRRFCRSFVKCRQI
ncbi:MAG: hypothetical protein PSN37_02255, partial [Alphaproteobacteria bacterium]|nr:hypothetical protein [Alphaproteobacteria bacterium]